MHLCRFSKGICNCIVINAYDILIAIHPSNTENGKVNYCISKKYGIFYLSNQHNKILQSSKYNKDCTNVICEVNNDDFIYYNKFIPVDAKKYDLWKDGVKEFKHLVF